MSAGKRTCRSIFIYIHEFTFAARLANCTESGTWSYDKVRESFGDVGVISLYASSVIVYFVCHISFAVTVYKFFQYPSLSKTQILNQCIIIAIPPMMSGYQMFSIRE